MKNLAKILAAGSVLMTAVAFDSQAAVVDGINLGVGPLALQDISAETIVTGVGQTLTGIGHITAIDNGSNFAAAGEELNFTYTATVAYDNGGIIVFSPGVNLQFFVDTAGTYQSLASNSATTPSTAVSSIQSGTNFLDFTSLTVPTLSPYNVTGAPTTGGFFGTGTDLTGTAPNGSGVGYFDVNTGGSGVANSVIQQNTLEFNGTTPYSLLFTSTFSVPGTNPTAMPVQDASTFTTNVIPEPDTIALLGLGLFVAASFSRKRQSA